ncbi:MAG: hypothetical protein AAFV32_05490 [Myxococcota bacterium]
MMQTSRLAWKRVQERQGGKVRIPLAVRSNRTLPGRKRSAEELELEKDFEGVNIESLEPVEMSLDPRLRERPYGAIDAEKFCEEDAPVRSFLVGRRRVPGAARDLSA